MISTREACVRFDVSRVWLWHMVRADILKVEQKIINGRVENHYDESAIIAILRKGKKEIQAK